MIPLLFSPPDRPPHGQALGLRVKVGGSSVLPLELLSPPCAYTPFSRGHRLGLSSQLQTGQPYHLLDITLEAFCGHLALNVFKMEFLTRHPPSFPISARVELFRSEWRA